MPRTSTAADELVVAGVGQFVDVLRTVQDGDGDGRVREQTRHAARVPLLDRPRPRLDQLRLDAREEIARRERLDEIVVGRRRETFDPGLLAGARRQHDDRDGLQIGVGAQLPQQPEAIELRHHDVGHDHVGRMRAGRGERFAAVADRLDVPPFGEQAPRVLAHVGVVIRQQHPAGVHLEITGGLRRRALIAVAARRRSVGQPAQGFLHVLDRRAGSGLRGTGATCSGGRWAAPNGIDTVKTLPRPS